MDLISDPNFPLPNFTPASTYGLFAPIPRPSISPMLGLTMISYSPHMLNSKSNCFTYIDMSNGIRPPSPYGQATNFTQLANTPTLMSSFTSLFQNQKNPNEN